MGSARSSALLQSWWVIAACLCAMLVQGLAPALHAPVDGRPWAVSRPFHAANAIHATHASDDNHDIHDSQVSWDGRVVHDGRDRHDEPGRGHDRHDNHDERTCGVCQAILLGVGITGVGGEPACLLGAEVSPESVRPATAVVLPRVVRGPQTARGPPLC